jgi:hypothetical protein
MPAPRVPVQPLRRRRPCRPSRPRPAQTLHWGPLTPTRHRAAMEAPRLRVVGPASSPVHAIHRCRRGLW